MKNITVTVDDQVYRQARVRAAERDTSVSALVAEFLRSLSESREEFERLRSLQEEVTAEIERFSAGDRLGRNEIHDRAIR